MVLVDARRDRFGLAFNGFYVRTDSGDGDISVQSDSAAAQVVAYYRVVELGGESGLGGVPGARLGIEPYAGARLTYVRNELEASVGPIDRQLDGSDTWVDPIVGARAILNLGERWSLRLGGDVGGFGVGSDFTWAAQGILGYRMTVGGLDTVLGAGYQASLAVPLSANTNYRILNVEFILARVVIVFIATYKLRSVTDIRLT